MSFCKSFEICLKELGLLLSVFSKKMPAGCHKRQKRKDPSYLFISIVVYHFTLLIIIGTGAQWDGKKSARSNHNGRNYLKGALLIPIRWGYSISAVFIIKYLIFFQLEKLYLVFVNGSRHLHGINSWYIVILILLNFDSYQPIFIDS